MSRPSKRVSGQMSRALSQKWPWPVPTSSQAAGVPNGFSMAARPRYEAAHRAEHMGGAADAEAVVEVAVVEVEAVEGEAGVLEDMPAAAALFEGEAAGLALEQIGHADAYGELGGAAPGAVGAARLEEPLGARLEVGGVGGPQRFQLGQRSGRGRIVARRGAQGGAEGVQWPRGGGARQVGRAQRAARAAEDQGGLQPVRGRAPRRPSGGP